MSSPEACVAALEAAKAAGKIHHYAMCNFGVQDLQAFKAAGGQPISNQLPYNLLWRSIEHEVTPLCIQEGIGILCYSPLQQGLLAGKAASPLAVSEGRRRTRIYSSNSSDKTCHCSPGLEDAVFGDSGALEKLRQISTEAGCSMVDCALGWLLAQDGVSCVIVGASCPAQVVRNASLPKLSPEVVERCGMATSQLKELNFRQGNFIDQYAKQSRIK